MPELQPEMGKNQCCQDTTQSILERKTLTVREVVQILDARVLTGEEHLDSIVHCACCSDLMSDVLAFVHEKALLLTGLANTQVIRTAEMLDLSCIIFVRGKQPPEEVMELARELDVTLLAVNKTMFVSAGLLYQAGLSGTPMGWENRRGVN